MSKFTVRRRIIPAAALGILAAAAISIPVTTAGSQTPTPTPTPTPAPAAPPATAPTLNPDRITLNPAADNTSQQVVTWRTVPGVAGQAQISADTSNPWEIEPTTVAATARAPQKTDLGYKQVFHSATFTDLKPGTTYLYRVGDGTNWSGWMPFRTSDPKAEYTSLIAFGDIQRGISDQWTRVAYTAAKDRPTARAMISVGDQVNTFDSDREWGELFTAGGLLLRSMQWIPAVGNHEYRSTNSGELSPQFRDQFDAPAGPTDFPQFEGTVYTTDIDNVRVVTLNSYYRIPLEPADEQRWLDALAAYLEKQLANNPREFTIVNMHYPIYSSSPDRGNPELRNTLEPVFEKYKVDLVLQGHDQAYVSGQRDANPDGEESGPIYVTSSSAGRHYPLDYSDWTKNGAEVKTAFTSRATYQVIDVKGRRLSYAAKDSTGKVLDRWTIRHTFKGRTVKFLEGSGVAAK